ncbi:MAG: hypothetical protein LBJ07_02835 [Actinomycetes bacterium]|jgi:hypothetical protein|nr:hypothetical protein [Actinomycetes bacterium]
MVGLVPCAFAAGPAVPGEAGAVTASTTDEFTTSLSDVSVTKIYLLSDISFTGLQWISGRASMTIVGHGPTETGVRHTLEQASSISRISNRGTSAFVMEYRDIVLYGRDVNGFLFNVAAPLVGEVWLLRLVHAEYSGPMLAHANNFTLELRDSNLVCRTNSGGDRAGELAQVGAVDLRGKVDINFIGDGIARKYIFYLLSPAAKTYLRVASGAEVTMKNSHPYSGLVWFAGSIHDIAIGAGARVVYTGKGPLTSTAYTVKDMLIDTGAHFEFHQTGAVYEVGALLRFAQSFTVNAGATCVLTRDGYDTDGPLIRPDAGAKIHFDKPRLVVLQSNLKSATSGLFRASSGTFTISGTVNVVNVWRTTGSISRATPEYLWQKEDLSAFSFTGEMGVTSQSSASAPDLGANDFQSHVFDATNFDVGRAYLLIVAAEKLAVDTVPEGATNLTGTADRTGDSVQALYGPRSGLTWPLPGSLTVLGSGTAGNKGEFNLSIKDTTPLGGNEVIYLLQGEVTKAFYMGRRAVKGGIVQFRYVPAQIEFVTSDITAGVERIARAAKDWHIDVMDERLAGSNWNVYAKVARPLETSGGGSGGKQALSGSLMFVAPDGTATLWTAGTEQLVHKGTRGQNAVVSWAATRGVLLEVDTGTVLANTPYSTTIEWTLQVSP